MSLYPKRGYPSLFLGRKERYGNATAKMKARPCLPYLRGKRARTESDLGRRREGGVDSRDGVVRLV